MEKIEFGNTEQIQALRDRKQSESIDAHTEKLSEMLYCCDNLSKEHSQLLDFLEGTTGEKLEALCEELTAPLDKTLSDLKEVTP